MEVDGRAVQASTAAGPPAEGSPEAVVQSFRDLAAAASPRSPLYAHLAAHAADDPVAVGLMQAAPPQQRTAVLLFAAVHDLVLRGLAPDLARYYPTTAPEPAPALEAYPTFRRVCADHADALRATMASRSTQTNEVGRCALLVPALGLLATEVGELALVDVGASAGLNLLVDRYAYRYEPGGSVGGPSPLTLVCHTRGSVPVPAQLPRIGVRIGLDAAPIDLADPAAAQWLQACVWPDQLDRFERLGAAVAVAREQPPDVRTGDARRDLVGIIAAITGAHPVVMTTWVLGYLGQAGRRAFLDQLDRVGTERDLSWIAAEAPTSAPELPIAVPSPDERRTTLTLVRWRGGQRHVDHLAIAHPHGFWLHWSR